MDYGRRVAGDGAEGRLVSMSRFTGDWAGWEMHRRATSWWSASKAR